MRALAALCSRLPPGWSATPIPGPYAGGRRPDLLVQLRAPDGAEIVLPVAVMLNLSPKLAVDGVGVDAELGGHLGARVGDEAVGHRLGEGVQRLLPGALGVLGGDGLDDHAQAGRLAGEGRHRSFSWAAERRRPRREQEACRGLRCR